jgi:prephenate dehydrogenase
VPCHPVAGLERHGPQAGRADLFRARTVVITPEPETSADAVAVVEQWWRAVGARVVTMTAAQHDRLLAATSHLPHLLASAFMQQISAEHLPLAGGGFRDFTRIAESTPRLWAQIFAQNHDALICELDRFEEELRLARELLRSGDASALESWLQQAQSRRGEYQDRDDG